MSTDGTAVLEIEQQLGRIKQERATQELARSLQAPAARLLLVQFEVEHGSVEGNQLPDRSDEVPLGHPGPRSQLWYSDWHCCLHTRLAEFVHESILI